MVTVFAAALVWEGACAKSLLDSVVRHYRDSREFSCRLSYDCTKTAVGRSADEGTNDSGDFDVNRSGESYSVKQAFGSPPQVFRATRTTSGLDPYLVYDHHLTYWLGMRTSALSKRLVSRDATGPIYSMFEVGPGKVAVYETYLSPTSPPFQLTYALDPDKLTLLSVSTCGVVNGFGAVDETTKNSAVLWSETVELTRQTFGF